MIGECFVTFTLRLVLTSSVYSDNWRTTNAMVGCTGSPFRADVADFRTGLRTIVDSGHGLWMKALTDTEFAQVFQYLKLQYGLS